MLRRLLARLFANRQASRRKLRRRSFRSFLRFESLEVRSLLAVSAPDLADNDDTGILSTDNVTFLTEPTFNGTADAGSTVEIFDGTTLLGSANLVGTDWTFTVPVDKALSDGSHTITAIATDSIGNVTTSEALIVSVDTAPPIFVTATLDRVPGATNWFNISTGAPTFNYTASDAGSGLDANSPTADSFTFGEGTAQQHTFTVTDVAGNSATASQSDINVDLTAPAIDAVLDKPPAATGWYNIATGAPTATFSGTDSGSGVVSVSTPFTFGEGSHLFATGKVTDLAGNSTTASFFDIFVDLTAPTLTESINTPDLNGWYNIASGPAVITYTATDATSGVTDPASYTFTDGANQSYAGITVTDAAGNISAATAGFTGINQDTVAPTLTESINTPDLTGWYNIATGPAVITYSATDATSGVTDPTSYTFTDGVNHSHSGITVTDAAGNTSAATSGFTGINQDTVAPTLSESINSPDVTGWYNIASGPAVITYTTTDATSGVTAPASYTFSDGANQSHAGITVTDAAGNTSAATSGFTGINQDTLAPTLTESINAPAVTGWYNIATGPAVIIYTATDATSGVITPASYTFSDGANQSHSGISVTDAAGNTSAATTGVTAIYQDTVAPTVTAMRTGLAYASTHNGWNNTNVTVSFTASDVGGSGVINPADQVLSTDGTFTSSALTVTDVAGNVSSTANTFVIKIDKTKPATGLAPANGFLPSGAFSWSSTDPTSGVATTAVLIDGILSSTAATGSITLPAGQHFVQVTTTDVAGNAQTDSRTYLITGVNVSGLNMFIVGTNNNDTIVLSTNNAGVLTGKFNGITLAPIQVPTDGHIVVYGQDGNDSITVNGNISLEAHGGAGNDTISGTAAHDIIFGDAGDDALTGAAGNDVLIGGEGKDRLVGSAGNDILIGGDIKSTAGFTADYATLRSVSDAWSSNSASTIVDDLKNVQAVAGGETDDIIDLALDQLTGGAGRDWFIENTTDKITDATSNVTRDGDLITRLEVTQVLPQTPAKQPFPSISSAPAVQSSQTKPKTTTPAKPAPTPPAKPKPTTVATKTVAASTTKGLFTR